MTNEEDSVAGLQKTYTGGLAEVTGAVAATGTYSYYSKDHLGSTRGLFDPSKNLLGDFEYTSFGSPFKFSTSESVTRLFTGHHMDSVSGDYFASFRYLNTSTGGWLKKDPIGMFDGTNMYLYVQGSPVNGVDFWGLDTFIMNRGLGGKKSTSNYNPLSHTFIYTTDDDGNLDRTYSWGNEYDDNKNGGWFDDRDRDRSAAKDAIKKGRGQHLGGEEFDDYIDDAYEKLKESGNGVHWWLPWNNCKHEARNLFYEAWKKWRKDKDRLSTD